MEQLAVATQAKSQGIEASVMVIILTSLHGKGMQQRRLHQQQRAEIEVVADAALLVVDDGVWDAFAVDEVVMVGIHHRGVRVRSHAEDTFQGSLAQFQPGRFRLQQHIVGLGILSDGHQGVAARKIVDGQLLTAFQRVVIVDELWDGGKQEDVLYCLTRPELSHCLSGASQVVARQETVYFFSHEGLFVNY